jgi:hypothetical protein
MVEQMKWHWRASLLGRFAVVVLAGLCAAAIVYVGNRLLFSGSLF